jgi:hypothetical protein
MWMWMYCKWMYAPRRAAYSKGFRKWRVANSGHAVAFSGFWEYVQYRHVNLERTSWRYERDYPW